MSRMNRLTLNEEIAIERDNDFGDLDQRIVPAIHCQRHVRECDDPRRIRVDIRERDIPSWNMLRQG